MRIAGISGNEFTVFFAWVGWIVEPRREGLYGGFAFVDVHGDDSSDSDRQDSFLKNQMGANGILAVDVVYSNQFNKSEFVEDRYENTVFDWRYNGCWQNNNQRQLKKDLHNSFLGR